MIFMTQNESWPDKLLNYKQNLEGSIILNFWLLQQRTQPQRSFNLTKLPWLTKYLVRWPNKTKTRATESFWNTFCIGQTKFVVFFENNGLRLQKGIPKWKRPILCSRLGARTPTLIFSVGSDFYSVCGYFEWVWSKITVY